jgi:NAD(P)-dependent dehydrogenase (short-subunit alcohol dehydrogenase family)
MALYCPSKGAVTNLTRNMAFELAPKVRVNAVCPGSTMTDMLTGQADDPDAEPPSFQELIDYAPMKRIAEPQEIADGILYLANPASKFVTGAMLSIDGGSTAPRQGMAHRADRLNASLWLGMVPRGLRQVVRFSSESDCSAPNSH